eukprot:scaffold123666_cov48-Phaeocystis_antarctica.AAC.1
MALLTMPCLLRDLGGEPPHVTRRARRAVRASRALGHRRKPHVVFGRQLLVRVRARARVRVRVRVRVR